MAGVYAEGRSRRKSGGDASAKGGRRLLRVQKGVLDFSTKITKPTMWRGGVQILKKEEEDTRLLDRCEAKRKEWAKHWQCDEEEQNMQNKPWRNEELKECEEALPRLKEGDLEKASRLYKAKIGVGCDGFHPKVPLDLTKETRGEIVEFWEKVEQSGEWLQQACTMRFFLIPKNVTSKRPIALMPTLIRWWEALGAPEVAKWHQKYRVDWDATDGRNGGARRTVWEVLMEMERFDSKSRRSRGCGRGAGPCEGQPSCGPGLGDALQLPKKHIAGAVRLFGAPEASAVRRMRGGAAPDHHGYFVGVQAELYAFTALFCTMR